MAGEDVEVKIFKTLKETMPSQWEGDINDSGLCGIEHFRIGNIDGRGAEIILNGAQTPSRQILGVSSPGH